MSRCNPLLCTPAQFYNLIGNRFRLKPNEFDPGLVSDVTHIGTGCAMRVTDLPYDAYVGEVAVTRSGDVVPSIGAHDQRLELTGVPTLTFSAQLQITSAGYFRYSFNLGVDWSASFPTNPTTINGVKIEFLGPFTVGEVLTISAVGPARAVATVYNIANPIGMQGTGAVIPSGQVSRAYRIAIVMSSNAGEFYYSVNGGAAVGPATGVTTIPGTGITLTFDPGAGPTYYSPGDYWILSTRGSWAFDVVPLVVLSRPEQTGLRLAFDGPSLVAGDSYTFSTTAPPDLLEMLISASAEMMAFLRARYRDQYLLGWDNSVTINTGRIMAETLYDRKGMNWKEDRQTYTKMAAEARKWGELVGRKRMHPEINAQPLPGVLAPRVILGQDPAQINEGPFGDGDLAVGWIRL